jgi:DNA repair protein RadC
MAAAVEEGLLPLDPRSAVFGAGGAVSDGELVALAIGCTAARGARLVERVGPPWRIARTGVSELCALGQITPVRACRLRAALELGRRALAEPVARGDVLACAALVAARMRDLTLLDHEELHALGLDARNRLVVHARVATGALNVVAVEPRDVFRPLLRESAQGFVLVHNHPSGDPEPSDPDRVLTNRLAAAGELVGLTLLDHVVVARGGYFAFASGERRNHVSAE